MNTEGKIVLSAKAQATLKILLAEREAAHARVNDFITIMGEAYELDFNAWAFEQKTATFWKMLPVVLDEAGIEASKEDRPAVHEESNP